MSNDELLGQDAWPFPARVIAKGFLAQCALSRSTPGRTARFARAVLDFVRHAATRSNGRLLWAQVPRPGSPRDPGLGTAPSRSLDAARLLLVVGMMNASQGVFKGPQPYRC